MPSTPERLLNFSSVAAGGNSHWHIYYGRYYVGSIHGSCGGGWSVWHLECRLGDFAELEEAKRAVAEWYYGPGAE
jgi:hypothetical protein